MSNSVELTVNDHTRSIDTPAERSLLSVLRDDLGLTGCKIGCGEGACGSCTVLVDGQLARSCITPLAAAASRSVLTIEGLTAHDGRLHPLQQAFLDQDALQCGYCTPGMIMAALALLSHDPDPSEDAIVGWMQGNICRCGTYLRIVRAIQQAAAELGAAAGGQQ
jgi:aerobic-type carbon monoxide dehydrogenase small subunit (CoxS/CutS family)